MRTKVKDAALLLMVLTKLRGEAKGRTRLQKIVCLLRYKYKVPFSLEFRPYFYGPYSDELHELLETLKAAGLISEKLHVTIDGYVRYDYELTSEGKKLASKIHALMDQRLIKQIDEGLEKISKLPIENLIIEAKKVAPGYKGGDYSF